MDWSRVYTNLFSGEALFYHGCWTHGHDSITCPNYPEDPNDRVLRNERTYEQERKLFNAKMACLKKKFAQVKYHTVFWACEFDAMLKSAQASCFVENIQPNLRPFSRLKPRETVFGGIRQGLNRWTSQLDLGCTAGGRGAQCSDPGDFKSVRRH